MPYKYFYPIEFIKKKLFFDKSQWYDKSKMIEYQEMQLQKLVHFAYKNVPYYTELFDEIGLKPESIQSLSDLNKIPFLTKEIIRDNFDKMQAKDVHKRKPLVRYTSGSTGMPLKIVEDKNVRLVVLATLLRFWKSIDFQFGQKYVQIKKNNPENTTLVKHDRLQNSLHISIKQISKNNTSLIIDHIEKFGPLMIRSYPNTIYMLAKFAKEEGLEHRIRNLNLKCITTDSETLFDFQKKLIEEVFGAKVFDLYGLIEHAALITDCELQKKHYIMDHGVIEIVDKDGNEVKPGNVGQIVGTNLHNFAMPIIRYKTGDSAILSEEMCDCGRCFPVVEKLIGRINDQIVTPDGRYINSLVFNYNYCLKYSNSIDLTQIVQNDIDKITVKLMVNENYNENEGHDIRESVKSIVGEGMDVNIEIVASYDDFEISKSLTNLDSERKFRFMVSKISKR